MSTPLLRRRAILVAVGLLILGGGFSAYFKLRRDLRNALAAPVRTTRPLQFVGVLPPQMQVERWGGSEVEAITVSASSLLSAGKFGVADETGDISRSLPGLRCPPSARWSISYGTCDA